jgi:molybdate transport system ATP-binding protein
MIEIDLQRTRGAFSLSAKCRLDAPVTGLFGPSGAGKSTLLGMFAGLARPDAGHIILDGQCLFDSEQGIDVPIHRRRIGLVSQESRLFPHLNISQNLNYGFNLLSVNERRFAFKQIVDLLEIGHLLKQRPHQLSGGEKQRVALGRALLISPRVLLLDEPLAALDIRLKNQILPFLRRVKDEIQIPMVYVSHAINEILYLTTQIIMLDRGEMIAAGSFHEVINNERGLALAHTLGLENVLHVQVSSHEAVHGYTIVTLGTQQISIPLIDAPVEARISVSIAASNIALSKSRLTGVTIQNQLPGVVTAIHQVGSRILVSMDVGGSIVIAEVTSKALLDLHIAKGARLYCLIKTQSIRPLFAA